MNFSKSMIAMRIVIVAMSACYVSTAAASTSGPDIAIPKSAQQCAPLGMSQTQVLALQKDKFSSLSGKKTQQLAMALTACLGDADRVWRDEIAFSSLSALMRDDKLTVVTRRTLLARLQLVLAQSSVPESQTPSGPGSRFEQAFAALVLAEIARTQRIKPWMDERELVGLVESGTRFLQGVRDYRGYSDQFGWQHAVAHSADLMLQLSLLPELKTAQLQAMADAIASQVPAHDGHSYIFGEPGRLAVPVYYLSQRKFLSPDQWQSWFAGLAQLPDGITKDQVFSSEKALAWRHNVQFFLLSALANAAQLPDPALRSNQTEAINAALKLLP